MSGKSCGGRSQKYGFCWYGRYLWPRQSHCSGDRHVYRVWAYCWFAPRYQTRNNTASEKFKSFCKSFNKRRPYNCISSYSSWSFSRSAIFGSFNFWYCFGCSCCTRSLAGSCNNFFGYRCSTYGKETCIGSLFTSSRNAWLRNSYLYR